MLIKAVLSGMAILLLLMIISNTALITKLDQLSMKVDQLIAQGNDRTPDLVIVEHTTTDTEA